MVAGCGMTCVKYTVFFVNFLFFAIGCAAVGLGIYALVDKNNLEVLTKIDSSGKIEDFNARGLLQNGAIILIVGGAFLLVLGFLGCCGAVKEIKCLLALYAGIVILIIVVEVAAAGVAIAFRGRIEGYLQTGLVGGVKLYYEGTVNSSQPFSRAFDLAQVEFECCAVTNVTTDFVGSPWKNKTAKYVPDTCCKLTNRDKVLSDNAQPLLANSSCPIIAPGDNNPNTNKPCYQAIRDWVINRAAIIIGIAFGIVAIEILAVIFAICLYQAIGNETLA